MPDTERILILDYGAQYAQLIARRVRELHVYCEIHPYNISLEKIRSFNPKGIILSGGPSSVYATDAPPPNFGLQLEVDGIARAADAAHRLREQRW